MTKESEFKHALVRQLLREGGFGRRIEDKFAVGSLDMLLVTWRFTIYAEAKILRNIAAFPATVMQREQIRLFNATDNTTSKALVIGLKDGQMCFGLPGERYDAHYVMPWPLFAGQMLTDILNIAVEKIFEKELV